MAVSYTHLDVYKRQAGFCYTQLTDVEQETNGLLYADRTPKMEVDRIAACMTGEDGGGREEKPF